MAALPLLVAPGGGDQNQNAAILEAGELGLTVNRNTATPPELAAMVRRLAGEQRFKDRATLLQKLALRTDGIEEAAKAVESAALLGTLHLTARVDSMHWITRNDYDVLAVGLTVAYVVLRLMSHVMYAAAKSAGSHAVADPKKTN